jgi:hypothetical protein
MSVVKFVSNARVPLDALPTLKRKGLDAAGVTVAGASAEFNARGNRQVAKAVFLIA